MPTTRDDNEAGFVVAWTACMATFFSGLGIYLAGFGGFLMGGSGGLVLGFFTGWVLVNALKYWEFW